MQNIRNFEKVEGGRIEIDNFCKGVTYYVGENGCKKTC